jgi:DNA-binding CsgD family transcriptional regulator
LSIQTIFQFFSKTAAMTKEEVVKYRAEGMTLAAIGKIFGVSRQRVFQVLTKTERVKKELFDKKQIEQMLAEGKSLAEISKELGTSYGKLQHFTSKRGIRLKRGRKNVVGLYKEAAEYLSNEMKTKDVAEKFGINYDAFLRYLRMNGLSRRKGRPAKRPARPVSKRRK